MWLDVSFLFPQVHKELLGSSSVQKQLCAQQLLHSSQRWVSPQQSDDAAVMVMCTQPWWELVLWWQRRYGGHPETFISHVRNSFNIQGENKSRNTIQNLVPCTLVSCSYYGRLITTDRISQGNIRTVLNKTGEQALRVWLIFTPI